MPVSILCATYDKRTGQCNSCINGYFYQDGECIYPAIYDPRCTRYESAYCSQCTQGFYIHNYQCRAVHPQCLNFDYQAKVCRQCANGLLPYGADCQWFCKINLSYI